MFERPSKPSEQPRLKRRHDETLLPMAGHPFAPSLTPDDVLRLQRTYGNTYVQRLLQRQPHEQELLHRPTVSNTPMIGHFGKSAEGPDYMSYADYLVRGNFDRSKIPWDEFDTRAKLLLAGMVFDRDILLKLRMDAELGLLAGGLGLLMSAHFYAGSGTLYTHDLGSPLSVLAAASQTFQTEYQRIVGEIERQLRAQFQATPNNVDIGLVNVTPEKPSFGFLDGFALKAIIGGTQEVKIYAKDFTVDPTTKTYSCTLRWEIYDDFGVGHDDPGRSPGLAAFWLLQHTRAGHKPFVNKLVVEVPLNGSL